MRVLWIVNMVLPELAKELDIKMGNSGTWMFDVADRLSEDTQIEFAVACVHGASYRKVFTGNTTYYCIPGNGKDMIFYRKKFKEYWQMIVNDFKPDVVNIHGTEYCHALSFVRAFKRMPTVISLQGVMSGIRKYDFGGLSKCEILRFKTLKEWFHFNGVFEQHLFHVKNSKSEREMLNSVDYCMVVDAWHQSMARLINPKLKLFKIDYNLRDEFYQSSKWDVSNINRYEITTNPGGTALKGIHNLFKAIAIVKQYYPDVRVKIPGMSLDGESLAITNGYSKYLNDLIKKLGIEKNLIFLGAQTVSQMLRNMLKAHIQVIPSAIEGPSLVLREGMHLGVPTIATFRGGMADFVEDKVNGFLYDFGEYQYLAERILEIFKNDNLAQKLSRNAILKAEKAHDREKNYQAYLTMYKCVIASKDADS